VYQGRIKHHPFAMTDTDPLSISVVMATFNGCRFLPVQIASVLSQLAPEDELVVIDDASSDDTVAWLLALNDSRVNVYSNPSNLGVLSSFERGLSLARHPIVFLCDQDDVWLPGKRAAFVAAFEADPQTLVVVSDAELIDGNGAVMAPSFMATRGGFRGSVWSTLVRNRYLGCAMALRREVLDVALPIPRLVPMHDMWLGAVGALLGKVHYIAAPMMQYRRHGSNVSPDSSQGMSQMLRWRLALLAALVSRQAAFRWGRHRPMSASASSPSGQKS
jgi:glycosyltransferase involved in cell wall biosynthesis